MNKPEQLKKKHRKLLDGEKGTFKVVKPTKEELRIIEKGRREIKRGNYISWEELKKELKL